MALKNMEVGMVTNVRLTATDIKRATDIVEGWCRDLHQGRLYEPKPADFSRPFGNDLEYVNEDYENAQMVNLALANYSGKGKYSSLGMKEMLTHVYWKAESPNLFRLPLISPWSEMPPPLSPPEKEDRVKAEIAVFFSILLKVDDEVQKEKVKNIKIPSAKSA